MKVKTNVKEEEKTWTLKPLNIRPGKLIRKMAVAGVSLLLVTISLLGLTRSAEAAGFNRSQRRATNATPAVQGAPAIAYLKERKPYDSLRAVGNWRGNSAVVASSFLTEQKLTASDGAADDVFGYSVAISGSTMVVGAGAANIGGIVDQGAAYVFENQGGSWVQTQKLVASDGAAYDTFGARVAISGSTMVVGAYGKNGYQGAAYVFEWQSGSWVQTQKLTASDGAAQDFFGEAVAINGTTIVVGAFSDDIGGAINQGSAYVFLRQNGSWVQWQKLTASDGAAGDCFGQSVAINGSTIVVCATDVNVGGNVNKDTAYVFEFRGRGWSQTQRLTASDRVAGDKFGVSVGISNWAIVIGAPGANAKQGAAYVFVPQGGSWVQTQKLTASDGAGGDIFGYSVAISGSTIIAGAPLDRIGGNTEQGSAYAFDSQGGIWSETRKVVASDGAATDHFGYSVAASFSTIVVGALWDDIGGIHNQGSAYVYEP